MYQLGSDQMEGDISEGPWNSWEVLKAIMTSSQQPWTSSITAEASPGKMPTPSPLSMAGLLTPYTLSLDLLFSHFLLNPPTPLSLLVELAVIKFTRQVLAACMTLLLLNRAHLSTSRFQEGPLSSPPDICFTQWGCKSKGAGLKIVTTWKLRVMSCRQRNFRT